MQVLQSVSQPMLKSVTGDRFHVIVTDTTHKLPSRNTPLTSSFLRVDSITPQTMGNGIQRIITSRSRLDTEIPIRNSWKSPQWSENINLGSHAADMGEQRKNTVKMLPQSHVMHRKPTTRIALLKTNVSNIRRYNSRMEIFTAVMVRPYVIIAGIMY